MRTKWNSNGCPKCGHHSTVIHPGTPAKDGEKKTVQCAVCYTEYKITGQVRMEEGEQ